ncbi:MAG: serine hydrolase, partial [Chloroflexi bacterium]|nr:serine hydrolase [Chloroflexota bacterium]
LMLMEEGRLLLDDNVSQYLPAFDNPQSKDITIYQLLTHTSGLPRNDPISEIARERRGPPSVSPSLRSGADGHGRVGPSIEPGTEFFYSDRNARVLGALIEEISDMPAEEFIQKRILDPLQMNDSFFNHTRPDDQRRSRVAAAYRGEPGNWDKEFENSDLPLRQFLSPSWGLLSTGMDYAKFLSMMLNGGRFGTGQLLSPLTVKLATSPHSEYVYDAASLSALRNQLDAWTFYGLHIRLTPSGAFGHGGAQGTLALADPQQDLIFIYLTQSRGHRTRWRFVNLVYAAIVE